MQSAVVVYEERTLTFDFDPTPARVTWFQLDLAFISGCLKTWPQVTFDFDMRFFHLINKWRFLFCIYDQSCLQLTSIKACWGYSHMLTLYLQTPTDNSKKAKKKSLCVFNFCWGSWHKNINLQSSLKSYRNSCNILKSLMHGKHGP